MGRYSFEKKAKYRKEAVHTEKVSKKKNVTSIDLKEIIQNGEVDIKNVPFNKTTITKKRSPPKCKNPEGFNELQTDSGPKTPFNGSESSATYGPNTSVGNASKRYHNGNLLSDTSVGCSNGWIANALLGLDS